MGWNILKYLVILLVLSRRTRQQTTPEERCKETGNGSLVCMDCFRSGTCLLVDGTYTVTEAFACPSPSYCDDSLYDPQYFGQCSPLPATATTCSCSSTTQCIADPNNPAVILHCEASSPVSDDACSPPAVDLSMCSCASCSDTCPFLDDPNDACGSYFVCNGNDLIPLSCSGTLCFDQELCGCVDKGESSTEPATTKVTEPVTETSSEVITTKITEPITSSAPVTSVTCPPGCPLLDDPNDSCSRYLICSGDLLIPATCVGTLCFDQELCGCTEMEVTSTEPPTTKGTEPLTIPSTPVTSLTCPPGCPFLDDPNDSCANYFVCSGTELISVTCTGTLCFDQESCGCVEVGPSSTEQLTSKVTEPITTPSAPVTALTCPPSCPFLDDPNDSCAKYFVCSGDELIPVTCTGTLCFDQTACGCVDKGSPSTEQTTTKATEPITTPTAPVTSVTCPPDCPFIDDINDSCSRYFFCTGTELIPLTCPGTLCFNQASCGCVYPVVSTSELPTKVTDAITTPPQTAITCPPDCPFVDDPNDPCGKFYICDVDVLIPSQCPGILCFDSATCQCK